MQNENGTELAAIVESTKLKNYEHPMSRDASTHKKIWGRFVAKSPEQPNNLNEVLNKAAAPTTQPLNSSLGAIAEMNND